MVLQSHSFPPIAFNVKELSGQIVVSLPKSKVGLAATGVAAKGAGIGLDGIMKALNYLTSTQLQKLGQAALDKADQIKISDEEDC